MRIVKDVSYKIFDATAVCVELGLKLLGPLLVLTATFFFCFVTYTYLTEVLPEMVTEHGIPMSMVLTCVGFWLLGNLLFNYYMVVRTPPGSPPLRLEDDRRALLIHDPERHPSVQYRYCRACQVVKPMRTHHCSICKKCVMRMDHHCPWVNNCVGHQNYKFFFLFLVYIWAGSAFFLLASIASTLNALSGVARSMPILISTIMAFAACLATSLFLSWNIFLLLTNQTTIEFYGNYLASRAIHNPYHIGVSKNLQETFGNDVRWWTWCLPSRQGPPGDGVLYPMRLPNGELLLPIPAKEKQTIEQADVELGMSRPINL